MKLRKSAHSFGALTEHEYPSTPPIIEPGSPWPPDSSGNGNHARSGSGFSSGVREAITPGSHAPMSSIAAWWLATRPAELPAPCWALVVRKPSLNGWVAAKSFRSSAAFSQQPSLKSLVSPVFSMVWALHSRRAKL